MKADTGSEAMPQSEGFKIARLSPRTHAGQGVLHRVMEVRSTVRRSSPEPQIADLLASADAGEVGIDLLLGAYAGRELVVGALAIESPGAAALVLVPPDADTDREATALTSLLVELQAQAWSRGLVLLETLVPAGASRLAAALSEAGFRHLTRLIYMGRAVHASSAGPLGASDLAWVSYARGREALFCRALAATYAQSQDCPELTGIRTPQDVLAGHRAVGVFDPSLWWVALRRDEPVGVMLVNRIRRAAAVEVVYTGVAAAARGTGVGDALLGRAIEGAARVSAVELALAVDVRNEPARRLYRRWGFRETITRDAWIATSRGART